ncbi:hypothetical protein [Mucilaginibacter ginsenosidivorax]|uniref:Outer membrane beta-barrel protein n=1 Tax=Mucilaginibacter ginsenosidivorax TaxID=862126 RepID=A0A5B8W132_9SPHI|nr:hypothetical protein [Mucilaginibacter ginsenosidivorax]QEC76526.1 hypothetical protein FSB76_11415 [Mucilaginibacter ginsenosidivorax]
MKKYILFFVLGFTVAMAKAQSGFNYYEFGAGISASYGKAEADLKKQDYHPAVSLNFVYNYSPFLPITAELQKGTFSGGGALKSQDFSGRYFTNSYFSFNVHGDLQAGEILDYSDSWVLDRIKGLYIGTGIGFIYNNMTRIERFNRFPENGVVYPDPNSGEGFQGKNNSLNIIIPIRLGYEFKIFDDYDQPRYGIDISVQHYFAPGEGLDGYNDPTSKYKNNATDQYTFVTVGFKYNFGNTTSYVKLIRKFQY